MTDPHVGSSGHIRYEVDDERIGTITIDRPEKRNAMTYTGAAGLHRHHRRSR